MNGELNAAEGHFVERLLGENGLPGTQRGTFRGHFVMSLIWTALVVAPGLRRRDFSPTR
ncbi:hypothetical protein PUN4_500016 [Paraburkholderia unamae]|nr:hypothetical protein PUN4_500016 [Paraburkholderia unamae]